MRPLTQVLRLVAVPVAMAAFLTAAQIAGGLMLRTSATVQIASVR